HVRGAAGGVVRVEQRPDYPPLTGLRIDTGVDVLAGLVRELPVHQHGWIRIALADEAGVQPWLDDALELAEQVQLGLLARIAPLAVEQMARQVHQQRGGTHVREVPYVYVGLLADDAGIGRCGRADGLRRQHVPRILVEDCGQPFLGQLYAVALDAWEADFQRVALGPHGLDLDGFARRLGW